MDWKSLEPGDPVLVNKIVEEYMSQGKFDDLRRKLLSEVDTKGSYRNLKQCMESSVRSFLRTQRWKPDLNKNYIRDALKRQILSAPFLRPGINRVVDQLASRDAIEDVRPDLEAITKELLKLGKSVDTEGTSKVEPQPDTTNSPEDNKMTVTMDDEAIKSETLETVEEVFDEVEVKQESETEVEENTVETIRDAIEDLKIPETEVQTDVNIVDEVSQSAMTTSPIDDYKLEDESNDRMVIDETSQAISDAPKPEELEAQSDDDSGHSIINQMSPISGGAPSPPPSPLLESTSSLAPVKRASEFIGKIPKLKKEEPKKEEIKDSKEDKKDRPQDNSRERKRDRSRDRDRKRDRSRDRKPSSRDKDRHSDRSKSGDSSHRRDDRDRHKDRKNDSSSSRDKGDSSSRDKGDGSSSSRDKGDGSSSSRDKGDGSGSSRDRGDGSSSSRDRGDGSSSSRDKRDGSGSSRDKRDGSGSSRDRGDGSSSSRDRGDGSSSSRDKRDGSGSSRDKRDGSGSSRDKRDGSSSSRDKRTSESSRDRDRDRHRDRDKDKNSDGRQKSRDQKEEQEQRDVRKEDERSGDDKIDIKREDIDDKVTGDIELKTEAEEKHEIKTESSTDKEDIVKTESEDKKSPKENERMEVVTDESSQEAQPPIREKKIEHVLPPKFKTFPVSPIKTRSRGKKNMKLIPMVKSDSVKEPSALEVVKVKEEVLETSSLPEKVESAKEGFKGFCKSDMKGESAKDESETRAKSEKSREEGGQARKSDEVIPVRKSSRSTSSTYRR